MHCGGICSEKKVRTHVRVLFLVAVAYILLSPLLARAAEWNQGDRTHKYSDGTNNWIAHGYMTVGNATFIVPPGVSQVEVLVVAGGGGGGVAGTEAGGGGGGGGGVVSQTLSVTPGTEYPITVGAGGKGGDRTSQSASRGANGGNSSFGSVVANGGGGGGGVGDYNNGAPGGSGGGGAGVQNPTSGANGTAGQGNRGGNGASSALAQGQRAGGGGGGAAEVGAAGQPFLGGDGGDGIASDISGTLKFYGGGGGGGVIGGISGNTAGLGGLGGGGNGALGNTTTGISGSHGAPNTGGGGGGAGGNNSNGDSATTVGGDGGSGVVIVRFIDDGTLSVDLLSFEAKASGIGSPVTITWETAAEHDNSGFNIYRAANGAPGQKLNAFPIAAQGSETEGASYSFVDSDPIGANEVRGYYLEDVEFSGAKELHGPVSVGPFSGTSSAVDSWAMYD